MRASPVAVAAGGYVVSAFFAGGKYPDDPGVFTSRALVSGPLTGVEDNGADGRNERGARNLVATLKEELNDAAVWKAGGV